MTKSNGGIEKMGKQKKIKFFKLCAICVLMVGFGILITTQTKPGRELITYLQIQSFIKTKLDLYRSLFEVGTKFEKKSTHLKNNERYTTQFVPCLDQICYTSTKTAKGLLVCTYTYLDEFLEASDRKKYLIKNGCSEEVIAINASNGSFEENLFDLFIQLTANFSYKNKPKPKPTLNNLEKLKKITMFFKMLDR